MSLLLYGRSGLERHHESDRVAAALAAHGLEATVDLVDTNQLRVRIRTGYEAVPHVDAVGRRHAWDIPSALSLAYGTDAQVNGSPVLLSERVEDGKIVRRVGVQLVAHELGVFHGRIPAWNGKSDPAILAKLKGSIGSVVGKFLPECGRVVDARDATSARWAAGLPTPSAHALPGYRMPKGHPLRGVQGTAGAMPTAVLALELVTVAVAPAPAVPSAAGTDEDGPEWTEDERRVMGVA